MGSERLMETVLVWEDEKVLEMDGGEGCMRMYLMPLNSVLRNGENEKFYAIYIFSHSRRISCI